MLLVAAILSGILLAIAHVWGRAAGLLCLALLPFLAAVAASPPGIGAGALAGLALGVAYALPPALRMRFPPAMAAGLALYLALGFMGVGAGAAAAAVHLPPLAAALATAALAVLCDRATVRLLPFWGTAQSWIRPLTRHPRLARIGGRLGQPLALLVVVLAQCLSAAALRAEAGRTELAAAALAWALAAAWCASPPRRRRRTLRVAALGWDWQLLMATGAPATEADQAALLARPIAQAASAGARLLVTPETGLHFGVATRARWEQRLGALAAEHGITLVVGYLDEASEENRAGVFTPDGRLAAEYAKTHLVVLAGEHRSCRPGRGDVVQVEVDGVRVGVLICHDDNFAAPARRHARRGAQVLAVPTNDWADIRHAHLENVPWRAIENGLAVVRGASNGISAVIAADGRILARMDHTVDGAGLVVADVAIGG